jgi:hypothetical protein
MPLNIILVIKIFDCYGIDFIRLFPPSFTIFKDSHAICKNSENYQKIGSISKYNMMPLNIILVIKIFDCYGIDFIRLFPPSFDFLYILVTINYVSK